MLEVNVLFASGQLLVGSQHRAERVENVVTGLLTGASLAESAGTSSTRATIQPSSSGSSKESVNSSSGMSTR